MKNPFRFFKKVEPKPEPVRPPLHSYAFPTPGGIAVHRHWTDDPNTDVTIILVGGQVESTTLKALTDILSGEAFVTHYGKKRKTPRLVGLTGSVGMI